MFLQKEEEFNKEVKDGVIRRPNVKRKQISNEKPGSRSRWPKRGDPWRGPQEKPIKKTEGTLEKPIIIEFLGEEEKMKGTYDAPSRFWSSKFNVKSSRNLGQRKHGNRGRVLKDFPSSSILKKYLYYF